MNKIFIYFISSFLMLASLSQAQFNDKHTSWTDLTDLFLETTYPLYDVCFINPDTGFVVGGIMRFHDARGEVLMTKDAGNTWVTIFNIDDQCPVFCYFFDSSIGYFSSNKLTWRGGGNRTYRTLDGGISWVRDSIIGFHDISTINDTHSWALGGNGRADNNLYQTWDGGETWEQYFDLSDECVEGGSCDFNSIFFIDNNTGFGVGEEGLIMKFSYNENWERISSETSLPLNKVFFSNPNLGWIAGGYINGDDFLPVFLRTEDGGDNWTEIPGLDYLIHDLYFEDTIHGWALGENYWADGCMLETYNGGFTWEMTGQYLSGRLHALHMKEGVGWAVGDNGLLLKTEYTSTTGIGQVEPFSTWEEHQLSNCPNPFHSITVISYQLQAFNNVELNIYDLSGREVSTLLNESQAAGKYELEWNAKDMQPGIYFCELKTSQSRQVMKMILID